MQGTCVNRYTFIWYLFLRLLYASAMLEKVYPMRAETRQMSVLVTELQPGYNWLDTAKCHNGKDLRRGYRVTAET